MARRKTKPEQKKYLPELSVCRPILAINPPHNTTPKFASKTKRNPTNQSINHTYRFFLASSFSPKKLTTRETWNREDRSRKTTKPGNREKERKLGLQTKTYCFLNTQRLCARQKLADRYWSYATGKCKNSWGKPQSGRHRGCEAAAALARNKTELGFALGACCPPSFPRQLALCLHSVKR